MLILTARVGESYSTAAEVEQAFDDNEEFLIQDPDKVEVYITKADLADGQEVRLKYRGGYVDIIVGE